MKVKKTILDDEILVDIAETLYNFRNIMDIKGIKNTLWQLAGQQAEATGKAMVDITKKFIPDHKYEYYIDEVGKQQRKHTFDRCARCEWQAFLKDQGIEVKE